MLGIDRHAARWTWTVIAVLLLVDLIYQVRSTLFVFTIALLFAYLLYPLVNLIDRVLPFQPSGDVDAGVVGLGERQHAVGERLGLVAREKLGVGREERAWHQASLPVLTMVTPRKRAGGQP